PVRRHRGHEHGVHQDRPRQRGGRAHGRRQARVPQRVHPDHHGPGAPVRPASRRRHHHGDGLRLAGRRDPHRGVDPQPGFPGGPVRGRAARADHRGGQRHRGPRRRVHRSAHPGELLRMADTRADVALTEVAGAGRPAGSVSLPGSLRRFGRLRWGIAASVILLAIVASAIFAPAIAPHDPLAVNISHRLAPPVWMEGGTSRHVLGTDQVGRDLLARVIYGGRISLVIGVAAVLISTTIGVLLGLVGGYFGGCPDWTIMTAVNVLLTFPFVLLALAVIAVLGASLGNMIVVGRVYMLNSWWIAAFPGLAIFLTTLAINLMGNALRDWLDPHMKL